MSPHYCVSLPFIISNLYTTLQNRHQRRSMSASSLFSRTQRSNTCAGRLSASLATEWETSCTDFEHIGRFSKRTESQNMRKLCFLVQNISVSRDECTLGTTLDAYKVAYLPPTFSLPTHHTCFFILKSQGLRHTWVFWSFCPFAPWISTGYSCVLSCFQKHLGDISCLTRQDTEALYSESDSPTWNVVLPSPLLFEELLSE